MNITIAGNSLLLAMLAGIALILALIFLMKRIYAGRSATRWANWRKDRAAEPSLAGRNKYPEVNVFRLSGAFWQVGMAVALALTIMAFNWTRYEREVYIPDDVLVFDEDLTIDPPRTKEKPQPPPPPPPPVIEEVPNEVMLEEEAPDFFDQSVEESTLVPKPPVMERKPAPTKPLPPPPDPESPGIDEIFRVVEEMPRFPGCEEVEDAAERKQCADRRMLEFIYRNIKYPAIARENGVEGTVVVTFVVETDGRVTDAQILRDPGAQLGPEALRVINLMNEQGLRWTPGKQRARPVRVQFNLPVKFKLE